MAPKPYTSFHHYQIKRPNMAAPHFIKPNPHNSEPIPQLPTLLVCRCSRAIRILRPNFPDAYDHSKNNPFLCSGPKGLFETKEMGNNGLYLRLDLPGLGSENMSWSTDMEKKMLFFGGDEQKELELGEEARSYLGCNGLLCNCCEISDVKANMKDGVLRMIISQAKSKNITQPKLKQEVSLGGELEQNPFVLTGSKAAYELKQSREGLYARVDMPGVAKEDVKVLLENGELHFCGVARRSGHEERNRYYAGAIRLCEKSSKIDKFVAVMKNGVLRMLVSLA